MPFLTVYAAPLELVAWQQRLLDLFTTPDVAGGLQLKTVSVIHPTPAAFVRMLSRISSVLSSTVEKTVSPSKQRMC